MSLADRVGRRLLTLISYVGICISIVIIGMGFQLSKVNSPEVTSFNSSSGCGALSTCYDCTYEYDMLDGEDLVRSINQDCICINILISEMWVLLCYR